MQLRETHLKELEQIIAQLEKEKNHLQQLTEEKTNGLEVVAKEIESIKQDLQNAIQDNKEQETRLLEVNNEKADMQQVIDIQKEEVQLLREQLVEIAAREKSALKQIEEIKQTMSFSIENGKKSAQGKNCPFNQRSG